MKLRCGSPTPTPQAIYIKVTCQQEASKRDEKGEREIIPIILYRTGRGVEYIL